MYIENDIEISMSLCFLQKNVINVNVRKKIAFTFTDLGLYVYSYFSCD